MNWKLAAWTLSIFVALLCLLECLYRLRQTAGGWIQ